MNEYPCRCSATASNLENTVKKAYSQLWASQKGGKNRHSRTGLDIAHTNLMKKLSPCNGMKVLDVGSGDGDTVLAIAEKIKPDGKAVGIDFSSGGVESAREKARRMKLDNIAEFHLVNATKLPFPDNYFDAVISECVVCLVPDKQKALNEKVRVLKTGGKVIMHDVVYWTPMPRVMTQNAQLYCGCVGGAVNKETYIKMMEKAGLTDIETVDLTKESQKTLNRIIIDAALDIEDEQEFHEIMNFVRKGGIGYILFSGTKTETQ